MEHDTIFAPSTALGGPIAVIRLSGTGCAAVAGRLLSADVVMTPRMLRYVRVADGTETLDDCMAVYLPGPNTYTGEDMLEINCHGGAPTVRRIMEALEKTGVRIAENGAFTKRAFLNGKMDLSQAEAVMDIITAEAEQSRRSALQQLHGSVCREIRALEELLLNALAGIDAAIDYPEEMEEDTERTLPRELQTASTRIEALLRDGRRGRAVRDGIRVVITGMPNTGKSSLLNALLGHERAIVTEAAGTTRDVIEERAVFCGVPVRLSDTAGLRESGDMAEQIGVRRAREAAEQADVRIVLLDGSREAAQADTELLEQTCGTKRVITINKSDLPRRLPPIAGEVCISARTGTGLEDLEHAVLQANGSTGDLACITNERHLAALEDAQTQLADALCARELTCAATDIREALHDLGQITGTDADASLIDRIFARFCVGK